MTNKHSGKNLETRPNILLITTDQQRWDALSLWGTPGYHTPHIDALAKDGMFFRHAYPTSPVCTPARVSMITGQYTNRHGAFNIGMAPVPALEGPTVGTMLSGAGYRTACIGKTHFVSRKIEDQHVAGIADDAEVPDTDYWDKHRGPYCGFDYLEHHRFHNASGKPNAHYRLWLEQQGADVAAVDAVSGENRPPNGVWDIDPDLTQNAWITDSCKKWIGESHDDPWFVMANYQDPHYPYICPEPYYSAVDMSEVDLGGIDPDLMKDKPDFYQYFMEKRDWRDNEETQFWDGINVPNINHYSKMKDPAATIRAYIGMCNMVDDYVGRLIQFLKDTDQYDNTLIVFTSDHGDQLGQHGVWGKGAMAFEDNQCVPLIMHWPKAQREGNCFGRGEAQGCFSHVDLLSTFVDVAGLAPQDFTQGISHAPLLKGDTDKVRDWAIVDHIASYNKVHQELDTTNLHQITFVHDKWKLVVYEHADYGELYNLAEDPKQITNLWDVDIDKRHAMMHRLLQAQMEASGVMPLRIWAA